MIGSLRGRLTHKSPQGVLVEAGGVGYLVTVPTGTLASLPPEGREVFLFIHTHVREDALQLFGFVDEEQKRMFLALTAISGIGPKVAMNVISSMSVEAFVRTVEAGDAAALAKVPGLGKKTAQRIVLEMKGKLPTDESASPTQYGSAYEDALSALVNLGYKKAEAIEALEAVRGRAEDTVEALIKETLKHLTGGSQLG